MLVISLLVVLFAIVAEQSACSDAIINVYHGQSQYGIFLEHRCPMRTRLHQSHSLLEVGHPQLVYRPLISATTEASAPSIPATTTMAPISCLNISLIPGKSAMNSSNADIVTCYRFTAHCLGNNPCFFCDANVRSSCRHYSYFGTLLIL